MEAFPEVKDILETVKESYADVTQDNLGIGSTIFAVKPGDGSAREQAASCQKVLGGWANIANEYATKRYRSNLINWGMLPLHLLQLRSLSVLSVLLLQVLHMQDLFLITQILQVLMD